VGEEAEQQRRAPEERKLEEQQEKNRQRVQACRARCARWLRGVGGAAGLCSPFSPPQMRLSPRVAINAATSSRRPS
jgi:hypothetical protein